MPVQVQNINSFVPENVQKKLARDSKLKTLSDSARKTRKEAAVKSRATALARAQQYKKEYQAEEQLNNENRRKAKAQGGFYVQPEHKVLLVIRIRGINKLHPDVAKILRLLRLRQIHNATFVRVNTATLNMLKKVEPFVTFGYPNLKTVQDLIYKRGFLKINKQRIPITSNAVIETALGNFYKIYKLRLAAENQVCAEDLIHEIYTCGTNFKKVNNTLWPFKLRCPKGGFQAKRHGYHNGGDFGNREEMINELVRRML